MLCRVSAVNVESVSMVEDVDAGIERLVDVDGRFPALLWQSDLEAVASSEVAGGLCGGNGLDHRLWPAVEYVYVTVVVFA